MTAVNTGQVRTNIWSLGKNEENVGNIRVIFESSHV